jgi:pimeloyl-ACP methyl ester carboxylesterase
MSAPTPFKIKIEQPVIDGILAKVRAYQWHEMPDPGMPLDHKTDAAWAWGTPISYMKEVANYWTHEFDWREAEAGLNRYPHFKADVEGTDIHFLHAKAENPTGLPILISHGWPGSFFEFMEVIEPLNAAGHDVIVPSLIGYGFSGKPKAPISPRSIARHFSKLMSDVLGIEAYIAQGGDWGSAIAGALGYDAPACKGIHLNMQGWTSPGVGPQSEDEQKAAAHAAEMFNIEGAYFRIQSTKPQSLSYAMMDSPVGQAAWILEKFRTWSDVRGGDLESVYTKDQLLTNIMIYLVTDTFNTASWIYNGLFTDPSGDPIPPGARIQKPCGIASFPGDEIYSFAPRSQVERSLNVVHWSDMDVGGHFAALEQPDLFVSDLLSFIKTAGL